MTSCLRTYSSCRSTRCRICSSRSSACCRTCCSARIRIHRDYAQAGASQGKTLYQLLQDIYAEFGYYKESLISVTKKGKAGLEEIAQMMVDYRNNPPQELAGSPVIKVIDYNKPEETGLPASNVLQFYNEAGDVVTVRPSGTEPKIKFYFGIKGSDADAKNEALRAQFSK